MEYCIGLHLLDLKVCKVQLVLKALKVQLVRKDLSVCKVQHLLFLVHKELKV
jgi:hypothetical protein